MVAEQSADRIGQQHAARDACSRAERALQEAATAGLRLGLLHGLLGILRLGGVLLGRRLGSLLASPGRGGGRWRCAGAGHAGGRGRTTAAEEPAEERATGAGLRGFQFLHAGFQLLQLLVGGAKSLFLDNHRLGEKIGGVGLFAHGLGDKGLGLLIARIGGRRAGPVEQSGKQLAFFGAHGGLPGKSGVVPLGRYGERLAPGQGAPP